MLTMIVALSNRTGGIGIDNDLPWRLKADLAFFKRTTSGSALIMGNKTYKSIGRPLPNRLSIVITRDPSDKQNQPNLTYVKSIEEAIDVANAYSKESFVIGGGQIYDLAMPYVDKILMTVVETYGKIKTFDTYFNAMSLSKWMIDEVLLTHPKDADNDFSFIVYSLVKQPDCFKSDYNNGWIIFNKVVAGDYNAKCKMSMGTQIPLPVFAGVYLQLKYSKKTFVFPANTRTCSPYYLKHFLPIKQPLSKLSVEHQYRVRVDIDDLVLKAKVEKRILNAIKRGLLLNGCSII